MMHLNIFPSEFSIGLNMLDSGVLALLIYILHHSNSRTYLYGFPSYNLVF